MSSGTGARVNRRRAPFLACLQSVAPEATQVGSDIGLSTTPLAQLKA
jgi:hypothetical protein